MIGGLKFQAHVAIPSLTRLPGRAPTAKEAERFNLTYCEKHFVTPLEQGQMEQGQTALTLLKAAKSSPADFLNTLKGLIEKKVSRIADEQVTRRYQAVYNQYQKAAEQLSAEKNP